MKLVYEFGASLFFALTAFLLIIAPLAVLKDAFGYIMPSCESDCNYSKCYGYTTTKGPCFNSSDENSPPCQACHDECKAQCAASDSTGIFARSCQPTDRCAKKETSCAVK